jgi:integrase/recombinase XerD
MPAMLRTPHLGCQVKTQPDTFSFLRAWLGHVSLVTTNVYAEVDLEMKAKALANCEVKEDEPKKPWREDKGLMDFLRTL